MDRNGVLTLAGAYSSRGPEQDQSYDQLAGQTPECLDMVYTVYIYTLLLFFEY